MVCPFDTVILQSSILAEKNLWSTTDTTNTISVGSWISPDLTPIDIWIIASNACGSDTDTMTLSFLPLPDAGLPPDSIQCLVAAVPVPRSVQDSTTYVWFDGSNDLSKNITSDTTIWLVATNLCGSDTDSMRIQFFPEIAVELGEDTFICPGDSIVLGASWPGANYSWTPGSSTNSALTVRFDDVEGAGQETFVVTITEGPCTIVKSKKVIVGEDRCDTALCKFNVASIFTPNGDGINDVLRIENSCFELSFNVSIYNRWGQLVFSGNERFNQWDGWINGVPTSDGTYYVQVVQNGKSILRNSITLIRGN